MVILVAPHWTTAVSAAPTAQESAAPEAIDSEEDYKRRVDRLIIAGEIAAASELLVEALGHYPMLEAPEVWARAALGFMAEHDRG